MPGNALDRAVRNGQGRQTNGIPVGPDTSLVVAEVILNGVDMEFLKHVRPLGGFRFFDDWELAFADFPSAEHALGTLQQICAEFGLHLNTEKTRIEQLPLNLESSQWHHEIQRYELLGGSTGASSRIIGFFDAVFQCKMLTTIQNRGEVSSPA